MLALVRLLLSGFIAFAFYAAWAYYANSLVTDNTTLLYKAALVQGAYSGAITLFFTFFLELFYSLFKNKSYCLPLIVPKILNPHFFSKECATTKTLEASMHDIERVCNGACLPGMLITPLPAIVLQACLVIGVNVLFETPNLWLTVAPSIFFSAVYGFVYSIGLSRKATRMKRIEAEQ